LRTYIATGEDSDFTGSKTEEEHWQVKNTAMEGSIISSGVTAM
jgi:hypothetical protein